MVLFTQEEIMKKKMKLNLNELNVKTFITSLDDEEQKQAKGGYFTQYILQCISSDLGPCCGGTSTFPVLCITIGCITTVCPIDPIDPPVPS
jgi:hypothetical protein